MIALLALAAWASPVTGRVAEHGDGSPVPGAEVSFQGADGAQIGMATTDEHGRFEIDLPDGTWHVRVLSPEYNPLDGEVEVPSSDPLALFVTEMTEFVVVIESFDDTPSITTHTIDAEEAAETPGTYDDAVRLVQSLPSVAVQREYSPSAGDLMVRGGTPRDNRYWLDGNELPYLYHYNQYASVFPTSQIDTLELYPSTFGADFGDAVGAVIDVNSKIDEPDAVHGSASINFVTAGADLSVPLGKGWWVSGAARRSFQDLVTQGTDQYPVWPRFHDFAVRAGRHTDRTDTQVFVWGAGDRYTRYAAELDLLDPVEASEATTFDYTRRFQSIGAAHRWKSRRARVVAALVHDRLRGDLEGGGNEDLRTVYLTSRYDDDFLLTGHLDLLTGADLRVERTWLDVAGAGPTGLLVAEEAPALARGVDVDDAVWRARTGVYAQLRWHPGDFVILPGIRLQSDSLGHAILPEPRLAVRWRLAESTALKVGGGLYHQAPDTEHLFEGTGDKDLPTTSSWQVAAGWEQTIAGRLEIGLDGYGKWLQDVLFYPIDGPAEVAGRGRAWGVELMTRYRIKDIVFLRGWIGYGRSQVDTAEHGWLPSDGDQPLAAGLVTSWDISPSWNAAVRYRIGSGLPWTPIEEGLYDATIDAYIPVPGVENSLRYPLYQRIDLHGAYTATFKRWSMTVSMDLWIVPKSSAQLYPTWSFDWSEQGWVYGPTIFPLLGVSAKF